eukprot:gb/GFBE01071084.1/.p1 GENE.gb/GFBE01071084.1/~~gb/GFBE01071084.1/.p1  ORF type:complete len:1164 (+),score=235.66 gb/GFBE01071084.1/:1-3492(+)
MLRAPIVVATRRPPSRCSFVATNAASSAATPSSSTSRATPQQSSKTGPVQFLGFAQSARQDVAGLLGEMEGPGWVHRLHALSSIALDLWPPESPHWRVAGPLVVPPAVSSSRQFRQETTADLSVRRRPAAAAAEETDLAPDCDDASSSSAQGLGPKARATVLQALCELRGGEAATKRNASVLLASLVDFRGVSGAHKEAGLAYQLSLEDLHRCICAVAGSSAASEALKDSPLKSFVTEGVKRLSQVLDSLALTDLLALCKAAKRLELERSSVEEELRRRLLQVAKANSTSSSAESGRRARTQQGLPTLSEEREVVALVAAAQALGEVGVLRSPHVRQALLPDSLSPGDAAEILQHALPAEGSLSSAHEVVVAQATRQIVTRAKTLSARQIAAATKGVLALQARGDEFSVQQAAKVLRALWPRVVLRQPYFGPKELNDILWAYWWQLLYSRQEMAIAGATQAHPVMQPRGDASKSAEKEAKAAEDLCAKLLRPALERLGEMPLKQVAACLTSLAPPVRPPDVMSESDRSLLRQTLETVFSSGIQASDNFTSIAEDARQASSVSAFAEGWMEDFWSSELHSLTTSELLELACGLREAGMDMHVWPLTAVVAEVDQRLRPSGRSRPPVELSHFLLLRLCRVMDLWHGHEVEEVLKHLLSNPEAVKPLPTSYFVAVLSALCDFAVPKELPLRLVSSFLDRVEQGERSVQPEQWAEILRAIRPLDEWPSFDRITPRLLQRLVPHLSGLQPAALASVLTSLAVKPVPREAHSSGSALAVHSPLERIPLVATDAVRQAVEAGQWDFQQAVSVFDALGKLGWYGEPAIASLLGYAAETPFLEPHAPLMLPLVRACTSLRVHHAPLLHKVVLWYCWCYAYLWPKPLPSEKLDELLELAEHLMELSFQSLEIQGVLAENLKNPNASARQSLALLSVLARFSHFPPEFKETCARVCSGSTDTDLASLTPADLVNAFNVHLCAVFDGPAALKHWLTEDEGMKTFFQVHTSQKWYQKQDQERTTFLQSPAFLTLRDAAEKEGLELRPSEPGEVYHVELVSRDAKERLSAWSDNPPVALVCIKSKEQLRWYVPITAAESDAQELELQNRCHQFRFMFRGAVQKIRHLQAMGYRPVVVWMSEWNGLATEEERRACLRAALGQPGAFRPASAEEEDAYR